VPTTRSFGDACEPDVGQLRDATHGIEYTQRLGRLGGAWWKHAIGAQAPYRWHIRRLDLGRTLDVGCGLGRNLLHLDGNGVGVDTNPTSVRLCRDRGLSAYTVEEFFGRTAGHGGTGSGGRAEGVRAIGSGGRAEGIAGTGCMAAAGAFDSLLLAHVLEHMGADAWSGLLRAYLPFVRPGGRVVVITPQERGFAADPTHVRFVDFADVRSLADACGLVVHRQYSFPFPRPTGRLFPYNEFVTVATIPAAVADRPDARREQRG
jgi:SAM-dependent methyltransferase